MKERAEPMKSWYPSSSWRSACSGERMKFAAITGMETTLLISFARYARQPGSYEVGSSQRL